MLYTIGRVSRTAVSQPLFSARKSLFGRRHGLTHEACGISLVPFREAPRLPQPRGHLCADWGETEVFLFRPRCNRVRVSQ